MDHSIPVEVPSLGMFLVSNNDTLTFYDANDFQIKHRQVVDIGKSDTREKLEFLAIEID